MLFILRHLDRTRLPAVLIALAVAAWIGSSLAQAQAQPRQHGIFLDSVDVNLINVEVVVTDRSGQPVSDLRREDFEIFDDGRPMEITNFYKVTGGQRVEEPIEGWYNDPALADALPVIPEMITVVVVVDQQFISGPSRKKVFAALRDQLDELLAANAQVMVVEKDSQVEVRQPLTTDPDAILAALAKMESKMGTGAMLQATERRLLKNLTQGAVPGDGAATGTDVGEIDAFSTYSEIRGHMQQLYSSVRRSVRVLNTFLGSLSGIEGRKAVIYAADSLPRFPAETLLRVWFEKYGDTYGFTLGANSPETVLGEFDTQTELNNLIANANASQVTFYPVSAGLGAARVAGSAEFESDLAGPGFAALVAPVRDDGLTAISVGTGGAAAIGSLHVDWIVDRVRSDMTHYYSLGYPAPHRGDDRNHQVKVRVLREGLEVRYLHSYRDKTPDEQMRDRTVAALLHDRLENPLNVRLAIGEGAPAGEKQKLEVPIAVRIPISKLVLVPEGEARKGQVSIFFSVRDELGRFSEPQRIVVPVQVGGEKPEGVDAQNAVYATKLLMRPGPQTIAVGVRDDVGQISSAISRNVLLAAVDG